MLGKNEKVVTLYVVGNSGVGKTSFINRWRDETFQEDTVKTEKLESFSKKIDFTEDVSVLSRIWDTSGQEKYWFMLKITLCKAHGFFVVYSIYDRKSFEDVKKWVERIRDNSKSYFRICLVGNKTDIAERLVTKEEGEELADRLDCDFIETSCKDDVNVQEAFSIIAGRMLSIVDPKQYANYTPANGKFHVEPKPKTEKDEKLDDIGVDMNYDAKMDDTPEEKKVGFEKIWMYAAAAILFSFLYNELKSAIF